MMPGVNYAIYGCSSARITPEVSLYWSFYWEVAGEGGGGVCAERDVTQEASREQTRQSVMVGGSWIKKRNFNAT